MEKRSQYILSVDVEDYFQVEAFTRQVSREDWDRWPSRIEASTLRSLDICDSFDVKGTYFVLGWVARRFPALVREIHARGHEVASHSFWHRPVCSLTREAFRADLRETSDVIQQASGARVIGFRAPTWSITAESLWALDVLAEEGYLYDSSIYPIHHDLFGLPGAKRFPYRLSTSGRRELIEFPPATVKILNGTFPAAGGGYLRILPFRYTQWAIRRLEGEQSATIVVYLHPWELDPHQPKVAAPLRSRFRHYTNLTRMQGRLEKLLAAHRFVSFASVLDNVVGHLHRTAEPLSTSVFGGVAESLSGR